MDCINTETMQVLYSVNELNYCNVEQTDKGPRLLKDKYGKLIPNDGYLIVKSKKTTMELPKCDRKYWKEDTGKIVEVDDKEKAIIDQAIEHREDIERKEELIQEEIRNAAIENLKSDGILDSNGDLA